ncbi:hypothetical protein [Burkholderia sp. Nafp2/4-1b]|uniref:hypothetical protein n=1 Tax=Burkholderia sp. Nafp2/4-1b TaxID=2116686 RepID=UPI0013CF3F94|nr:hypothetical protein [Burkholderia sp. Nafp2/4-1b]
MQFEWIAALAGQRIIASFLRKRQIARRCRRAARLDALGPLGDDYGHLSTAAAGGCAARGMAAGNVSERAEPIKR